MVTHADLMLLSPGGLPFSAPGWLFELKYDGFRVLTLKERDRVRLLSRHGNDLAESFPELIQAVAELPVDEIALDGELVVVDGDGAPKFERLCKRAFTRDKRVVAAAARGEPAAIFAFDLLCAEGVDYRNMLLIDRKAELKRIVRRSGRVRCAQHVEEHGVALFRHIERMDLEGIVAKRSASIYRAGRTGHWIKIKTAIGRAREAKRMEQRRR